VVGFVSGPAFTSLLSADRKGSTYIGMVHSSDWYKTLVEGIAGGTVPRALCQPHQAARVHSACHSQCTPLAVHTIRSM
jgi:hypothetical protein